MPKRSLSVQCSLSVPSVSHVVVFVVLGGANDLASHLDDFSDKQHDDHHRFEGCDASALDQLSAVAQSLLLCKSLTATNQFLVLGQLVFV